MDLNTFIQLYKEFLHECSEQGLTVEPIIEEFGNYLASVTDTEGIEVQFFIEVDLENLVKLSDRKNQSMLNYGIIRQKGQGDLLAKEILEAFHRFLAVHSPKPNKKVDFL